MKGYVNLNGGELIALLLFIFGLAYLFFVLITKVKERRETERAIDELINDVNASDTVKFLRKQGYIFPDLFTIKDVHLMAMRMGYNLTAVDAWRVVKLMVEHFNPEVGLSRGLIRQYIRFYLENQNQEIE